MGWPLLDFGYSHLTVSLLQGVSVFSARNILLLLMVLFEIVHISNCRSEDKSIFQLSPLRSPILVMGTITAFLLHLTMIYLPVGNSLLSIEPVSAQTWIVLLALSLTVLLPIELDKFLKAKAFRKK